MKYFLIAGEASGDLHASNLIHALRTRDAEAEFIGLGGDKMRAEGCELLQDYRKMAFMGVLAVLANLRTIRQNFRIAKEGLLREQPDVLILIDYPSFNLKIARFCKEHLPHTRVVYYIPPKIWAWKTWRVHAIARYSDLILGIFPFEPAFYAKYGYQCTYVGNPTMDSIRAWKQANSVSSEREKVIALLPGSRPSEIRHCLPVMLAAAREVCPPDYRIAVTAAPGIDDSFYARYLQGEELTRNTYALVSRAEAAVVNSGTATLETALLGCPQTAVYYIALARYLGWLKPLIFRIPHFTLVNIIPGREVIRELVAFHFTKRDIRTELTRLLGDQDYRARMEADYRDINNILGNQPAAENAARIITELTPAT